MDKIIHIHVNVLVKHEHILAKTVIVSFFQGNNLLLSRNVLFGSEHFIVYS